MGQPDRLPERSERTGRGRRSSRACPQLEGQRSEHGVPSSSHPPRPTQPAPHGRLRHHRPRRDRAVTTTAAGHPQSIQDRFCKIDPPGEKERGKQSMGTPARATDRPGEAQREDLLPPAHPALIAAPPTEVAAAGRAARLGRQLGADPATKHSLHLGLPNPYDQHTAYLSSLARGPRSRNLWGPSPPFISERRSLPRRACPGEPAHPPRPTDSPHRQQLPERTAARETRLQSCSA